VNDHRPHVFCRDCRFFLDARRPPWRRCLHPHARFVVETATQRLQRWQTPQERNPDHTCGDFRSWRRWESLLMVDPAFLLVGGLLGVVLIGVWCTFAGR
jgi:hypothetical protein